MSTKNPKNRGRTEKKKKRRKSIHDKKKRRKSIHDLKSSKNTVIQGMNPTELKAHQRRIAGPWLHAWHDPVANINAFTPCLCLTPVSGDREYKLLVADASRMLRVYKDTTLASEHTLMDVPVAIASFNSVVNQPPSVAVAAGSCVYIYRNLRPYYKFNLPPLELDPAEKQIWVQVKEGKLDIPAAAHALKEARDTGVVLGSTSMDFLALDRKQDQVRFVKNIVTKKMDLRQLTVVTVMKTLAKSRAGPGQVSSLVIGTESRHIMILDPLGSNILAKVQLPSVPSFLCCVGAYDVDYRLVIACRNGSIYTIKKGKLIGRVIPLETQPVGLCVIDTLKTILVSCMHNVVHSFHYKGNKNYSIYLPAPVTNMSLLQVRRTSNVKAVLIALQNGEIRLYNKKQLINTLKCKEAVTAMVFGPYHREDGALALVSKSGALTIKYLRRQANLKVSNILAGPPPEQDIPLRIPQKTTLYVQQTQREREQAVDMHRIFQRDLCKLRLTTARSYVKLITDGQGPLSATGNSTLRVEASVLGMGPLFKIKLNIKNTGPKSIADVPLTYFYNPAIYSIQKPLTKIPVLVPTLIYSYEVEVENIDPNGAADTIRVFICNNKSTVPAISATVKMPVSELAE